MLAVAVEATVALLAREAEALVRLYRAGATVLPAQSLGLDRDLGTIEEGKVADRVIVDGDHSMTSGI